MNPLAPHYNASEDATLCHLFLRLVGELKWLQHMLTLIHKRSHPEQNEEENTKRTC